MEAAALDALLVGLVGLATLLATLWRGLAPRLGIPPLVGYILIGLGFGLADKAFALFSEPARLSFELLGALGLVALLFRVGLGSHPQRLLEKLPRASLIWLISVAVSGLAGWVAARMVGFGEVASLVAAVALTATSIGVALPPWQESGRLDTEAGTLALDVAELDDLSGVLLMALLLAAIPALQAAGAIAWGGLVATLMTLLLGLAAFTAGCWAFAHWLEPPLTRALERWETPPARLLVVVALGALIAAGAGLLGFSLAIGALFAGLIFSGAPESVREDRSYGVLHDFLVPFFFIGIGLKLEPTALQGALAAGAVLLVAAVAGKLVGTWLPALLAAPAGTALPLAVSMVPRAEIAMVVVDQARRLGPSVVPDTLYGAMTLVTLGTCALTPPVLGRLLARGGAQERVDG